MNPSTEYMNICEFQKECKRGGENDRGGEEVVMVVVVVKRIDQHTISHAASSNGFPQSRASNLASSSFLSVIYSEFEIADKP